MVPASEVRDIRDPLFLEEQVKEAREASAKPTAKKAVTSKRAAGRPTLQGNSVGSAAVLEATTELLRELAPDRITLAEVARRSNVDRRLIRYYFKDRAVLLRAVFESLSKRVQQMVEESLSDAQTPEERLRKRFETYLEFQLQYPYFRRLIVDEIMISGETAAEELLRQISLRGVGNYQRILEDGAAEGTMREIDPQLFYICLIGMQEMATIGGPILRKLGHPAIDSTAYSKIFSQFAIDLLMDGLRVREGT